MILLTALAFAADRPYDPQAYVAQEQLGLDPRLAHQIRAGLELIYLRRYEDSRDHFAAVEVDFPGTGLAAVCDTLVWQALMLENFDFRYDKQYWTSSKKARSDLEAALKVPGSDAWEHFLLTGVTGIEAIHTVRQGKYIQALSLAFEAMDHIGKSRKLAPSFTDLGLADGMYNYWRTVVTSYSSMIPDFGDHRAEGLSQMQAVARDGVFLGPPTHLALTFSYAEERKTDEAIAASEISRAAYPDNVINNLVLGSLYVSKKRFSSALKLFDEVLQDDPKNKRARYWRALTLQHSGKLDDAERDYRTYLQFDYLEPDQRAQAHYRLGQVQYRRKNYGAAHAEYTAAVKLDGHKSAKAQLDRLAKERKAGKISW